MRKTNKEQNLGNYAIKGKENLHFGINRTIDVKNKISNKLKGHKGFRTRESYVNSRKVGMTGKHHTEKTKKKLRLKALEQFKKYGHPFLGKHLSEKHKINLSESHKDQISWCKGKKLSDEHKNKLKIARSKRIIPIKDTSIEVKIQNFLKFMGIEFFTHQCMSIEHSYQCDIFIPSMNLVIECDGDYWHKYPIGRDIDKIRTKELIEKGFKVFRLWECEIKKMNVSIFKNRLGGFYCSPE